MRRKEEALRRIGVIRQGEKFLDRIDFPVPERAFGLMVRPGDHQRKIAFPEHGRSEHLVSPSNALLRQRNDVLLDDAQHPVENSSRRHIPPPPVSVATRSGVARSRIPAALSNPEIWASTRPIRAEPLTDRPANRPTRNRTCPGPCIPVRRL
ncbi:hypothetical protein SDC9_208876 [bioreactor metagenome]|uniref:Uncharacterized protein n=1 Tax=bioreactor metagenome TaxID=1076179 RepID=A0A645JD92_9ZZZZ